MTRLMSSVAWMGPSGLSDLLDAADGTLLVNDDPDDERHGPVADSCHAM
jgi:hypothetical protein